MNSVMMDNWMIGDVLCDMNNVKDNTVSKAYQKFLSAIVLWDEIYYPENEMSPYINRVNKTVASILKPINDKKHLFNDEASAMYKEYFGGEYSEIITQGVMRYLLLSDFCGCDYLPCEARQKVLANADFVELNKKISRSNSLNYLDAAIDEYYKELFEKMGATNFVVRSPILTDYIVRTTSGEMSYVDRALHLKYEGPVERYRKYLFDMEKAFEESDYTLLNEMKNYSENLVRDIKKIDGENIGVINYSFFPMHSVSLTRGIQLKKRKVNLTFLNELGNFAIKGRKL